MHVGFRDFIGSHLIPLYFRKQCTEMLVTVRDLLQSDDTHTVQVTQSTERSVLMHSKKEGCVKSGKEGLESHQTHILSLETCHISIQTQTMVEMVYQMLQGVDPSDSARCVCFD